MLEASGRFDVVMKSGWEEQAGLNKEDVSEHEAVR